MTPATCAEAVRAAGELRLVIRLQQGADHFLQQLIRPCRQPQRTLLRRVLLVDVDAPYRGPPIALIPQRLDDRLNLPQAHAIHGLRAGARCHGTVVAVDLPVSTQIKLRIEQMPVQSLQWQSSLTAFVDDLQQGFGSLHYAYPAFPDRSWTPVPLGPVSGLPALPGSALLLRLLPALRHPRARAP